MWRSGQSVEPAMLWRNGNAEKKMKWRFILSTMAAMTAVVAVLLAVVNLWNYKETTRRVDQIMAAVMDAEQTGGEPFAGRDFPPETPFTARFFSVRTDGTEERTEVILDNISSVSEEEAREYAREVLEEGKNSGYYKSYRYRAEEQEGETTRSDIQTKRALFIFMYTEEENMWRQRFSIPAV